MDNITEDFLKTVTELLSCPSPSGREEKTRAYIKAELDKMGYTYEVDSAGNLIVRMTGTKSDAPLTIIAAHMDEISIVVTGIEANGDLKVVNSGGLAVSKLGESPVEILSDKDENIVGVLSMGSAHSRKSSDINWTPGWEDVRIKTGLDPKTLKEKGIRVGSSAVPVREMRGPYVFGDRDNPLVSAWTFDDRAGIAELLIVLKMLAKKKISSDKQLIFAFTVHEEGGCHGAKVLAHRERPDVFVAIDGCPLIDPDVLKLDGRPGVWSKDKYCHYDQTLLKELMETAVSVGTELQPVVYSNAGSDAGAVYNAGGAGKVAFLGHVRNNSHGFELARLSVFENTINTLYKYVESNFY